MSSEPDEPDKVAVSEGEKAQTQLAKDQINYYRSTYAPMEGKFADEAGRDYSSRLSAQAGSAGMREATPALRQMALSTAPVDTAKLGGAVASARNAASVQGVRTRDDGRLSALGVGLGVTADAGTALSTAGRNQTSAAIDTVRQSLVEQQADQDVNAAIGGAAGTLVGAGASYKMLGAMSAKQTATPAYTGTAQQSPVSLSTYPQQLVAKRGTPMFSRS